MSCALACVRAYVLSRGDCSGVCSERVCVCLLADLDSGLSHEHAPRPSIRKARLHQVSRCHRTICQMCVYKWTNKHQHRSALEEDERDLGVRNEEEGQRLNHWFLTWGSQSLQGSQDKSDGSGDDEKRWESEHFFQSHSLFILFVFCILFFYCLNSRSGFISFF